MNGSAERINFIIDYISAYERKIKLLNANGLFDDAKLFELFAIEVGSLYFGQTLSNLNIDKYSYPCVDLISDDKKTYIQVSTAKDIPAKIKTTLEKIRDSKSDDISAISIVNFFMMTNESVSKVKDYSGENQIGNVSFTKATNLITTNDVIQKAKMDLAFQIALYDLLKRESKSIEENSTKLKESIKNSIAIGLLNIECKINNEYEIDRSELISRIKADKNKNISVQGEAGSGKSALCKMLLEGEEFVVYARAEHFLDERDINNIWGFNITQTLEYLGQTPITFFIDSLEFTADIPNKLELLQVLYESTKEYPNAKIITSCRTSDKNAFMRIDGLYSTHQYEVPELTVSEQALIAEKYPVIKKMADMNSYAELLKSPFYINLIVSKAIDIDQITDENELREHIWQHVICMNDTSIMKVVESIAFTRAKNFSLGVARSDYDTNETKIIDALISKSILIEQGNNVRLKYDIFEDICFEQYLDNEFDHCKGKYNDFFSEIESLDKCIYRRYQIWISNKLLAKDNREKFLYNLIFSDIMPQNWKKQTEIGLVKSRYCAPFFDEYGQTIINNERLNDFIKIVNLYAFEINPISKLISYVQLRPCGAGRASLIRLITQHRLYEKDEIPMHHLKKLCTDYSNAQNKEKQDAENACLVLVYILEKTIAETNSNRYYKLSDDINRLLAPIYQMAKYTSAWIKGFWDDLTVHYKSNNEKIVRLAEDIIEDTLGYQHIELAIHLPTELCELAELFWTHSPTKQPRYGQHRIYENEREDISYFYGLSKHARNYGNNSNQSDVFNSSFFHTLFINNFWIALEWAISFVNNAVSHYANYASQHGEGLLFYELYFVENETKRSYMGSTEMWLATIEDHRMPKLIGDLIYCLKEVINNTLKEDAVPEDMKVKFAENIKRCLYEKSNNTALLTVIADIGIAFRKDLPGFALDLATSIDIIFDDLTKLSIIKKDPTRDMLEQQILMAMGMPSSILPDRYNKKYAEPYTLQMYVMDSQMNNEYTQQKCHRILNYLYSIIPNDETNAVSHLQIQKMDLRDAKVEAIDNALIAVVPIISGEAKKITENAEKRSIPKATVASAINNTGRKLSEGKLSLSDCLKAIEEVQKAMKDDFESSIDNTPLIALVATALINSKLEGDIRAGFCRMWIDGIRSYFSNGSFIFEYGLSIALFKQVEFDICHEVKNEIKQLVLDLVLYNGQH